MRIYSLAVCFVLFMCTLQGVAQRIVYSEPNREDSRRMNFEVIGKLGGNFLVYKNLRTDNFISVYDNDMKELAREKQEFLPGDKLINVDFFTYTDFSYMVYQYQKRNIVYCDAVKIDGNGKKASEVMQLDTSHIGFATNNKVYSVASSEDKSKILLFKVNSRNRTRYLVTTILYNNNLDMLKRSAVPIAMEERNEYLGDFNVDNDGDAVFTKFTRNSSDAIVAGSLVLKPAMADSLQVKAIGNDKLFLDELHVKVDNVNKRYFLASFYYKQRRGNIEGFYFYVWDKATGTTAMENMVPLTEELRREARGDANIKMAFNDYFIKNIIVKKDGGFIIGSEAYYTTSRYNSWNRWDYLYGSPFYNSFDYYSYSPMLSNWYWRNRYFSNNQAVRYHADNVTILSFDNTGKLEWNGVIHKSQFDDESDDRISYQVMNTGGQLHFIFNQEEKRALLLNDFTLSPSGDLNHNPTLKNLDRGYEFMTKYGKQVSSKQMIIPCYYRNYICFAKIDYSS